MTSHATPSRIRTVVRKAMETSDIATKSVLCRLSSMVNEILISKLR